MASNQPFHIAIIGAGLSGLSLGLALLKALPPSTSTGQPRLTFTIYESRPSSTVTPGGNEPVAPSQLDIGGAVMLSPNGLRVLDSIDVYSRIKSQGHNFRSLFFQVATTGDIKETYSFGDSDKYGYDALRLYRRILVKELLDKLAENGVQVQWGKKFSHIVSEDPHGASSAGTVTFAFTDGTQATATLLVGADGIHSRVRRYMYPDLTPKFMHMGGLTAAVSTANLDLPKPNGSTRYPFEDPSLPHPLPLTLMHPTFGAFIIAPQAADGSEVLIGRQMRLEEDPGHEGLRSLMSNKQKLIGVLRANVDTTEGLPAIVRNAVKDIPEKDVNLWPFYIVPRLDRWLSEGQAGEKAGRVVILGDAAHAVPPSAGQGVNQAFEDVWTFALVLAKAIETGKEGHGLDVAEALAKWQAWRQGRIDKILELNRQVDIRRMPDSKKTDEMRELEKKIMGVDWLYEADYEREVEGWFKE